MKTARFVLYFLIILALVGGIFFYRWIASYLVLAIIFAYILNPWVNWLERKHIPRTMGVLLVYAGIGIIIAWSMYVFVPVLINQAKALLDVLKSASVKGEIRLLKIPFIQSLANRIDNLDKQMPILGLKTNFLTIINTMNETLMNIPEMLVKNYQKILAAITLIATIPLIGFFLLKDSHIFIRNLYAMVPNRYFELTVIIVEKVDEIVGKYLRAMFYEVIVVGSLASIVLSTLGVPYGVLIGFLAGVANIIPYFGPILGILFAITSILMTNSPAILIVYVVIGMYLIQVIDNNLVYPLVVSRAMNMHPLVVLLTVLAGGWAAGLLGMLVSVPIVYLVYSLIKVLYINLKEFEMI